MFNMPEMIRIPVGKKVDALMDWFIQHFGVIFDAIGYWLLQLLYRIEQLFLWVPWWAVVIAVGVIAYCVLPRRRHAAVLVAMLLLINSFGLWDLAMMTLALVSGAVMLSLAVGLPTGIAMARSDRFQSILQPMLDGMQTMPSFVYLIPALMLFGLGKVPALFATLIYAIPPVIRLTNVAIREVPVSAVEAARSFGASYWQTLFKVQLPLARPTIMVGINQTTMMALAMVVVASMIGARGLGLEVLLAINRIEIGRGFEAGISIVFLAIIIDRITNAMATRKAAAS